MLSEAIGLTLFPATMAFAAASDLLAMTIANRISLILVAGFAVVAVLGELTGTVLLSHLAAGAAVLAVAFLCFACRWIGGGDAKLAAVTTLWFGFDFLLDYLIYAALFGGALTLLLIQFRKLPLPEALARQSWILRLHETGGGVPYGIALAAAALTVYPKTAWMPALGL